MAFRAPWQLFAVLIALIALLPLSLAATTNYITYQDNQGNAVYLADNRKPSLYTGNFGSCLENSLINVTRFDASYYHDNMTVIFDIEGNTNLTNEALMIYIGVFAYGESRFELPFDPCKANIYSMCPMKQNVSIAANGQIPLAQEDVAMIPELAYSIPDFEGQAILRIFSNTTQTEIACYSAVVTNGSTFSQPAAVGTILGVFALAAVIASFATAIYGSDIPTMRTHYAHSLSVLVVFAVFQHIFFTGALSMNWPSVLVAFWSNYAWAAGIIYSEGMQNSFDKLTRGHRGNTTTLGAAGSGTWASNVGGGYDIHAIYKRSRMFNPPTLTSTVEHLLSKRASSGNDNVTNTQYLGHLVRDGLPLPGNYSGFPGTLYQEAIPASNAFLTGFVWFLVLILIIGASVPAFKFILDFLCRRKIVKTQRLDFFRTHWKGYTEAALLRTCYIGFFPMTFFTIFQFSYGGAASVLAIAAIVFVIFLVGIFGVVAYAVRYRLRTGGWDGEALSVQRTKVLGFIPWFSIRQDSLQSGGSAVDDKTDDKKEMGSLPSLSVTNMPSFYNSIHEDEHYTKKFGWLASRFRRTKWWFFALWTFYEFVRAAFLAGASGYAMVQVFGLLVIEFFAFVILIWLRPFEGQRMNVLMVYLLGFSKIATVALSAAFDVSFNMARITTTAIGIVIIVIQGVVTIALMICIVISAITSYYSVMRYREEIRPKGWNNSRQRYFKHLEVVVRDRPLTPRLPTPEPEEPKGPYFSVTSVRRAPKIEDEDAEFLSEIALDPRMSRSSVNAGTIYPHEEVSGSRASRAMSNVSRTSLPYGARIHRGSWSTRDFSEFNETYRPSSGIGGAAVATTPISDMDGVRPLSQQMRSRDSFASMDRSGYGISTPTPGMGHRRNFSESVAEEIGRSNTVSPVHHSAPASPSISRSASLNALADKQINEEDTIEEASSSAGSSPADKQKMPRINTALRRSFSNSSMSPPPSPTPRSPTTPQRPRSRLMKHRPRESIDEANEDVV